MKTNLVILLSLMILNIGIGQNCTQSGTLTVYKEIPGDTLVSRSISLTADNKICSDHFSSEKNLSYATTDINAASLGNFKEVMAYFHLEEAKKFSENNLLGFGITIPGSTIVFNSEVDFPNPGIMINNIGQGTLEIQYHNDPLGEYNPLSEDAFVIAVGYFKALHLSSLESTLDIPSQDGIDFGVSNYLAFRYVASKGLTNNTKIYKHGGLKENPGISDWHTLDMNRVNGFKYPITFDDNPNYIFYSDQRKSEVLSASLWSIATILGDETKVDELVTTALSKLSGSALTQPEAAAQLFQEAKELNFSKQNLSVVYEVFLLSYGKLFTSLLDLDDVLYFNSFYRLPYIAYHDIDQDGQFNNDDYELSGVKLNLDTDGFVLTNSDYSYALVSDEGTYTLSFDSAIESDWQLTSTINSFIYEVDSNYTSTDTFFLGLYPSMPITEVNTFVHSEAFRCNTESTISIIVKNKGNTFAENVIVNYKGPFDETIPPFNILPGDEMEIELNFSVPGPPDITPGEDVSINVFASYNVDGVMYETDTVDYQQPILCSYDPNDKLVYPNRVDSLIFSEEQLHYTVRFQNTGNAEAFKVEVRDSLDSNLDLNTFEIVGSSHIENLSTILSSEGEVSFLFTNINLPDSTSNPEGSQGFVSYEIRPKPALDVCTEIQNTASIYFDSNPPIVTNTTTNYIYYTCDDGDPCTIDDRIDKNGNCVGLDSCNMVETIDITFGFNIYPNPSDTKVIIESFSFPIRSISLYTFSGYRMFSYENISTSNIEVDLIEYPNGAYLIEVNYENGTSEYKKLIKI